MKKFAVIIVAILYFAVSSGVIVNMHYCMNRFASADVGYATSQKDCGTCGMHKEKSHGCCHDEVKLVKIDDDQNKGSQFVVDWTTVKAPVAVPSQFIAASFIQTGEPATNLPGDSPPLLHGQDTYLQLCVFRI